MPNYLLVPESFLKKKKQFYYKTLPFFLFLGLQTLFFRCSACRSLPLCFSPKMAQALSTVFLVLFSLVLLVVSSSHRHHTFVRELEQYKSSQYSRALLLSFLGLQGTMYQAIPFLFFLTQFTICFPLYTCLTTISFRWLRRSFSLRSSLCITCRRDKINPSTRCKWHCKWCAIEKKTTACRRVGAASLGAIFFSFRLVCGCVRHGSLVMTSAFCRLGSAASHHSVYYGGVLPTA